MKIAEIRDLGISELRAKEKDLDDLLFKKSETSDHRWVLLKFPKLSIADILASFFHACQQSFANLPTGLQLSFSYSLFGPHSYPINCRQSQLCDNPLNASASGHDFLFGRF